jgi:hypothetical protein
MISQLSNREAKFRKKFIAEHHYNKTEQKIFDEAVREQGGYTVVYAAVKRGHTYAFMTVIATRKLSQCIKAFTATASATSKNLAQITESLNAIKEGK